MLIYSHTLQSASHCRVFLLSYRVLTVLQKELTIFSNVDIAIFCKYRIEIVSNFYT